MRLDWVRGDNSAALVEPGCFPAVVCFSRSGRRRAGGTPPTAGSRSQTAGWAAGARVSRSMATAWSRASRALRFDARPDFPASVPSSRTSVTAKEPRSFPPLRPPRSSIAAVRRPRSPARTRRSGTAPAAGPARLMRHRKPVLVVPETNLAHRHTANRDRAGGLIVGRTIIRHVCCLQFFNSRQGEFCREELQDRTGRESRRIR